MILDDAGRGIREMADVCIVGAGPVGIALALECERRGLSVTLLESGSDGFDADAQALSTIEVVDPRHHAPSDLTVRRALGGTSLIWCGRCVPYDDIDFERREHVAESGWPIEHRDVARYYAIATSQLDCGKPVFRAPAEGGGGASEGVHLDSLERWGRQINSRLAHSHRLTKSANLRIHLKCTAVDFRFADEGQRLEGLVVASGAACRDGRGFGCRRPKSVMDAGLEAAATVIPGMARLPAGLARPASGSREAPATGWRCSRTTRVRTCRSRGRICGRGSRRRPSA